MPPAVVAGAGLAISAAGTAASIASQGAAAGRQGQALDDARNKENQDKVFAQNVANFRNTVALDLSKRAFANDQYATETAAQQAEWEAGSYGFAADVMEDGISRMDNRIKLLMHSAEQGLQTAELGASMLNTLAKADESSARIKEIIGEEQVAAYDRSFRKAQSSALASAAASGVDGVVANLLVQNDYAATQTERMMRLNTYSEAMALRLSASAKEGQGFDLRAQAISQYGQATMQAVQGLEEMRSSAMGEYNLRVQDVFTRARASAMRDSLVYQAPLLGSSYETPKMGNVGVGGDGMWATLAKGAAELGKDAWKVVDLMKSTPATTTGFDQGWQDIFDNMDGMTQVDTNYIDTDAGSVFTGGWQGVEF